MGSGQENAARYAGAHTSVLTLCKVLLVGMVVMLAAQLRFGAVANTTVDNPVRADARDYVTYAYNINHKGVYSRSGIDSANPQATPIPDAVRAPGYPLFLTLFIDRVTASELAKITSVQALVSTLVVLLTYFVCVQIVPWVLALVASFLVAISPHLINANIYILSESMAALVVMLFIASTIYAIKSRAVLLWGLAGVMLGVCALVRPAFQYFPLFLAGLMFLKFRAPLSSRFVLSMIVGFALVYAPWVIRNIVAVGQISDPTLMINFLHHGMYPGFTYGDNPQSFGFPYHYDPQTPVISQSVKSVVQAILAGFMSEPVEYFRWYVLEKPAYLWSWNIVQGAGDAFVYPVTKSPYVDSSWFVITHAISAWSYLPSVLIALLGCVAVWIPRKNPVFEGHSLLIVRVISLLLVYYTALHMVGAPFPRYSVPFKPLMYVMAVVGVWSFLSLLLNRKLSR